LARVYADLQRILLDLAASNYPASNACLMKLRRAEVTEEVSIDELLLFDDQEALSRHPAVGVETSRILWRSAKRVQVRSSIDLLPPVYRSVTSSP